MILALAPTRTDQFSRNTMVDTRIDHCEVP